MVFKKFRKMKVYEASGYNYKKNTFYYPKRSDGFARIAAAKEKTVGVTFGTVGGLVSGMKQS